MEVGGKGSKVGVQFIIRRWGMNVAGGGTKAMRRWQHMEFCQGCASFVYRKVCCLKGFSIHLILLTRIV